MSLFLCISGGGTHEKKARERLISTGVKASVLPQESETRPVGVLGIWAWGPWNHITGVAGGLPTPGVSGGRPSAPGISSGGFPPQRPGSPGDQALLLELCLMGLRGLETQCLCHTF